MSARLSQLWRCRQCNTVRTVQLILAEMPEFKTNMHCNWNAVETSGRSTKGTTTDLWYICYSCSLLIFYFPISLNSPRCGSHPGIDTITHPKERKRQSTHEQQHRENPAYTVNPSELCWRMFEGLFSCLQHLPAGKHNSSLMRVNVVTVLWAFSLCWFMAVLKGDKIKQQTPQKQNFFLPA